MFASCFHAFCALVRVALRLLEAASAMIWPDACVVCGAAAAGRDALCASCASAVAATVLGPRCRLCDAMLAPGAAPRSGCRACRGRPLGVSRIVALGPHEGPLRTALRRFKFHGRASSARPLGRLLARRVAAAGLGGAVDVVVAVPPTPGRERQRGFDHAGALAAACAATLAIPHAAGALERPLGTVSGSGSEQKSRDRRDRWLSARQAFRPSARAPALLSGRHVLLIDDVMTSGATLSACAAACRAAGATHVLAACLTRQARAHLEAATPERLPPEPEPHAAATRPDPSEIETPQWPARAGDDLDGKVCRG